MAYYSTTNYSLPYYRVCPTSATTSATADLYYASPRYYSYDDNYTTDSYEKLMDSMKKDVRNKVILTMELRMAIDEEMKKTITEESVSSAKRALAELLEQISAAKKEVVSLINQREEIHKEVASILKQKEEMREQINNFRQQFKDMMTEVDQATEAYAKKNLRFALLDV